MNIIIKDLVHKPKIIEYLSGLLHDTRYSKESGKFDPANKIFSVDVPWFDLNSAKLIKKWRILNRYICPLLTVRLTINYVAKYDLISEDCDYWHEFLDWELKDSTLAIQEVWRKHYLLLTPSSELRVNSLTDPSWEHTMQLSTKRYEDLKRREHQLLNNK